MRARAVRRRANPPSREHSLRATGESQPAGRDALPAREAPRGGGDARPRRPDPARRDRRRRARAFPLHVRQRLRARLSRAGHPCRADPVRLPVRRLVCQGPSPPALDRLRCRFRGERCDRGRSDRGLLRRIQRERCGSARDRLRDAGADAVLARGGDPDRRMRDRDVSRGAGVELRAASLPRQDLVLALPLGTFRCSSRLRRRWVLVRVPACARSLPSLSRWRWRPLRATQSSCRSYAGGRTMLRLDTLGSSGASQQAASQPVSPAETATARRRESAEADARTRTGDPFITRDSPVRGRMRHLAQISQIGVS